MADGEEGEPLPGGVASDVRVVQSDDGPLVVKKALPKLKVAANWFSDPARSMVEVAAIEAFGALGGREVVPTVVWVKPQENCFAMRLVSPELHNWKADLMAGSVNLATARKVGQILGRFHARSANDPELAAQFDDLTFFRELRIEPFFEHVAQARPHLAPHIGATVRSLLEDRTVLAHGDFSPKNILARGAEVVILDFEVAHWGNPRFDVGYCLAHLLLKSAVFPTERALPEAVAAFLEGYEAEQPGIVDRQLAQVTGCLLLARLLGKSPVEYLDRLDATLVEARAVALLNVETISVAELSNWIELQS